jgi:hypothetical protein
MHDRITTIARAIGTTLAVTALVIVGAAGAVATSAPAQAYSYDWFIKNDTGKTIWLDMYAQNGKYTSDVHYPADKPLKPGDSGGAHLDTQDFYYTYYWGRFCYAGGMWNLPRAYYETEAHLELWPSKNDPNVLIVNIPGHSTNKEVALIRTESC